MIGNKLYPKPVSNRNEHSTQDVVIQELIITEFDQKIQAIFTSVKKFSGQKFNLTPDFSSGSIENCVSDVQARC